VVHAGTHLFPLSCLSRWSLKDGAFETNTRRGILQYVPIKVICAVTTLILEILDKYQDGVWNPIYGYAYITIIVNTSQLWALYNVVLFYHGLYENLKRIKPLAKFLSIKLVVFATFWQAFLIVIAIDVHFLGDTQTYTSNQVSSGINSFMVCIEMAIAAVAHFWVWPANEFENSRGNLPRLVSVLNPRDLIVDMHLFLVQPVIDRVAHHRKTIPRITSTGEVREVNVIDHQGSTQTTISPTASTPMSFELNSEPGGNSDVKETGTHNSLPINAPASHLFLTPRKHKVSKDVDDDNKEREPSDSSDDEIYAVQNANDVTIRQVAQG